MIRKLIPMAIIISLISTGCASSGNIKKEINKEVGIKKERKEREGKLVSIVEKETENYFGHKIDINKTQVNIEYPEDLIDGDTNEPVNENIMVHLSINGPYKEGDIISYNGGIDPESKELKFLYLDKYFKGEGKEIPEDVKKDIALKFIKENKLIDNIDSLKYEGEIKKEEFNDTMYILRFKNGQNGYIDIGIDKGTEEVMYFEWVDKY